MNTERSDSWPSAHHWPHASVTPGPPQKHRREEEFGCICFFLNGNALAGVWKDRLIARLGPDEGEAALREPHVRAFDITGRAMRNWVAVEPEGVEDDEQLTIWIEQAMNFVKTLPKK